MIIPTPEFDPLFADDGVPFGDKMREYIQCEFADILGRHANLLASDQGLEMLRGIYSNAVAPKYGQSKAA